MSKSNSSIDVNNSCGRHSVLARWECNGRDHRSGVGAAAVSRHLEDQVLDVLNQLVRQICVLAVVCRASARPVVRDALLLRRALRRRLPCAASSEKGTLAGGAWAGLLSGVEKWSLVLLCRYDDDSDDDDNNDGDEGNDEDGDHVADDADDDFDDDCDILCRSPDHWV